MQIKYLGHASFLIKTKDAKVITDPYDSKMIGLKFPKEDADLVTVSHHHADHDATDQIGGSPLVLDWPGEFEKKGVRLTGYKSFHDKQEGVERGENILFKIEVEDISILHCGDLGLVPDDNFLDSLGEIDILMVPVGGFYTITADEAIELVKKVEPSIVIPMHFGRSDLNPEISDKLTTVDEFLKKMGSEVTPMPQLIVKKEDLGGEMKIVVLES